MASYLDSSGLTHLWAHIKENFENVIEKIKINGTQAYVSGKTIDLRVKMNGSEVPFTAGTSSASANTINLGTVITAETQLSKGTTVTGESLTGGVVTDITVSNHQITLKKGSVGDAATKGVITAISASNSASTDLPTTSAVTNYVETQLTTALKYKGTVDSGHTLPASHKQGDVYVVASAGTYAGQACEVGDYIICRTTGTVAKDSDWDVINGENQVITPDSGTTLAVGQTLTIANVDGTDIKLVIPAKWSGVTKYGTVTSITPGAGLVNGSSAKTAITSSGTLMANLKDYTANTADSTKSTASDGGLYSVELDKSGKLAVRVPWKNTYVHPAQTTGNTTGATSLGYGDSFSAVTAVTIDASGHTSQIKTQKFTLPSGYVHPAVTTTNTTATEALSHGGQFSAITTVAVNASGHVTGYTTKTYTLPSDNDTWRDIKLNSTAYLTGKDGFTLNLSAGTGISLSSGSTKGDVVITNAAPFPGHAAHSLTVTNGTASAASLGTEITYVESVSGCSATNGNLTASTVRKKITIPVADTALTAEQIHNAILAADPSAKLTQCPT